MATLPNSPRVSRSIAFASRPPGVSLLFCSRAEILAAPAAEREAYYRIVDGLVAAPEAFGFRRDNDADLTADVCADRRIAVLNQDWGS
jgi:hypothetical protein